MAVVNLITVSEADAFNDNLDSWLDLDDSAKTRHIFNASLYIQASWECVYVNPDSGEIEVDWGDETTILDDHKYACAKYAYADSIGALWPEIAIRDDRGRVIEETSKLGTLLNTTRWSGGSVATNNPLDSIHAIMSLTCVRVNLASTELSRS